jgi:hypothetical protein
MPVECREAILQQLLYLPHVKTLSLRRTPALSILLLPIAHYLHLLTRLSLPRLTSLNQLRKLEYRERAFPQVPAPDKVLLQPQLPMLIPVNLMPVMMVQV